MKKFTIDLNDFLNEEGRVVMSKLSKLEDQLLKDQDKLRTLMFNCRGLSPKPTEYLKARSQMNMVKAKLEQLNIWYGIYKQKGNICGYEVCAND